MSNYSTVDLHRALALLGNTRITPLLAPNIRKRYLVRRAKHVICSEEQVDVAQRLSLWTRMQDDTSGKLLL